MFEQGSGSSLPIARREFDGEVSGVEPLLSRSCSYLHKNARIVIAQERRISRES